MKPRHHVYLDDELTAELDRLARGPGTSKSAIVAGALREHFRRRGMREIDELLKPRLDRMAADQRRLARDMNVLLESVSPLPQLPVQPYRADSRAGCGRPRDRARTIPEIHRSGRTADRRD